MVQATKTEHTPFEKFSENRIRVVNDAWALPLDTWRYTIMYMYIHVYHCLHVHMRVNCMKCVNLLRCKYRCSFLALKQYVCIPVHDTIKSCTVFTCTESVEATTVGLLAVDTYRDSKKCVGDS